MPRCSKAASPQDRDWINLADEFGTPIPMPEEVTKANIEHFRKLLEIETDAERRAVIERLLAEEKSKLAALRNASTERNKKAELVTRTSGSDEWPSGRLSLRLPNLKAPR